MARSYQQLTYKERCQIDILKKRGDCPAEIARQLKRSKSTISRELRRNANLDLYESSQADKKAGQRRFHKTKKIILSLASSVEEKLKLQWSPEQISGRLKKEGKRISHETIYKYIWEDKRRGGFLYQHLRHNGKKYNRRSYTTSGRGCIPNRTDIDLRPAIVDSKSRVGDWELDTIIGADHDGAIVSMVDRHSKLSKLFKVECKTAGAILEAMQKKLAPIKHLVLTLTSDNGKEFAQHEIIAQMLEAQFFFAKPYHSWERGLNEHTNGLVRQYLPKGTRFSDLSQEQLDHIEDLLNQRPRKILNFRTPLEVFQEWEAVRESKSA